MKVSATVPIDAVTVDAEAVDAIAARFAARGGQPGLSYGIVADGQLVHSGGCGRCWPGGPMPDGDTVFRIASMTKSFTATLVVLLRDRGALRLDDSALDYVPELTGVRLPAADSPAVTIRHLLTMTAGFPTDDPWGDRQQGLDPVQFGRMLAGGDVRCAWAPGTRFEYSNLGYAILGRVIEAVTGMEYAQAVRTELLTPLGMTQTGYDAAEFDPASLARGYRRDNGTWAEVRPDPHGAFAPMGGVFSCVRDLARWVAGFAGAFPPGPGHHRHPLQDDGHPLSRSTRREMQLGQVAIPAGGDGVAVRLGVPLSISYGFGLFTEDDARFGTIVQHSGGYPGYGSQMRWHPQTGLGAIVLANSTYAGAGSLAAELLAAAVQAELQNARRPGAIVVRGPAPDPGAPWPETLAARDSVNDLLQNWDDEIAHRLFSPNIALDRPLADRRADIELLRERIGQFRADSDRPVECESPAHCRWWLAGERGTLAVQIRLAPLRTPLVQQLIVPVPPASGSTLHQVLEMLISTVNAGAEGWPSGLAVADGCSADRTLRHLRVAAAWAGTCAPDGYLAGNGNFRATVRLAGTTGTVLLSVDISDSGAVQRVDVSLID